MSKMASSSISELAKASAGVASVTLEASKEPDQPVRRGLTRVVSWMRRKSSMEAVAKPLKRYLTGEVIPHANHYRNRDSGDVGQLDTRPTLDDLMSGSQMSHSFEVTSAGKDSLVEATMAAQAPGEESKGPEAKNLGWVKGVYVYCLLNMWGVMLFLRLSWIVGQAGILEGFAIITLSNLLTIVTTLSMSAVSTNGRISGGGIYYMISRSLGPEVGGGIGILFTIAIAVSISLFVIGFCEAFLETLQHSLTHFVGILGPDTRTNDLRLMGSITLVLILFLTVVASKVVEYVQLVLLFLLMASQIDFVVGSFFEPTDLQRSRGFVGYNATVFQDNMWSNYTEGESFFTVFAVFFPEVTGFCAGASMSGDLKSPGSAIPKGTLLAVLTTYLSFVTYVFILGATSLRAASGFEAEVVGNATLAFNDCADRACEWGLLHSPQMMEVGSASAGLITAGCFAATLSSAIACMELAPKVFHAVSKDKLFPYIGYFSHGWGPTAEPIKTYAVVFILALLGVLIGDLNQVSSLLSNFFVAAFALLNFSVFHASITRSPGWRPSFKYYNKWVSLVATLVCIACMFLMDYRTALVTFICLMLLYLVIRYRKPDANWGSSSQAQSFVVALQALQRLSKVDDHVKTFRPKILVLSGNPGDRPCLMDFANLLTKRISMLTSLHVIHGEKADAMTTREVLFSKLAADNWLARNKIRAFAFATRSDTLCEGVRNAIELGGLGKMKANMMLVGFKKDWNEESESAEDYYQTLHSALDHRLSVGILRVREGLDVSVHINRNVRLRDATRTRSNSETWHPGDFMNEAFEGDDGDGDGDNDLTDVERADNTAQLTFTHATITSMMSNASGDTSTAATSAAQFKKSLKLMRQMQSAVGTNFEGEEPVSDQFIESVTRFRSRSEKMGCIDVYWLYDDGGLTLLLPHILRTHGKRFAKCKLRVFFLASGTDVEEETKELSKLLKKFRIAFSDVILLQDVTVEPMQETKDTFDSILSASSPRPAHRSLQALMASGGAPPPKEARVVSDEDLNTYAEKTEFYLRMTEILRDNSSAAELVVMTLPLPMNAANMPLPHKLYMAWLDMMTRDMPPFLFVRGNQESVLTYYS